MLRRNDVICHVYQGKGRETILDENGMVRKGIMDARERGVLFDASNGCNNYDLEISRKAMKQGFIPDIISSDINTAGFYLQPLHSLPRIMSKYLDMGMCLERVLDAVTVCPARLIGREELASLDMAAPRMWPFLSWWKRRYATGTGMDIHLQGIRLLYPR